MFDNTKAPIPVDNEKIDKYFIVDEKNNKVTCRKCGTEAQGMTWMIFTVWMRCPKCERILHTGSGKIFTYDGKKLAEW